MIGTNVCTYRLSGGLSVGTVFVPAIFWSCYGRIELKYVPVIRNGHYYCSFGISSTRTIILVCKTLHNIEFWSRKKYWRFVSDSLTNLETEWPKKSQVTKSIQVASMIPVYPFFFAHIHFTAKSMTTMAAASGNGSVAVLREPWHVTYRWTHLVHRKMTVSF